MAQIIETLRTRKYETAIPGAYSDRSTATPSGPGASQGIVALVSPSDFTRVKPYTPTLASSEAALKALLPVFGADHAGAIWSPGDANEPDLGRPSGVYVVNAASSTRGTYTVTNGDGTVAVLKARIYGLDSNKIGFKIETGTSKGKKLTVSFESDEWVTDDIGGDNILGLRYSETEASTMTATVDPTSGVTVNYTKTGALASPATDSYTPDNMAFDGTITFTANADPTSVDLDFTITGVNKATGAADTEVVILTAGNTAVTSSKSWSSVTTIARTNPDGWGNTASVAISGLAFNLPLATYDTIQDVMDAVNAKSAAGFSATDQFGDASTRLVSKMDTTTASDIKTAIAYFKADLDFLMQAFGDDEADTPTLPIHPSGLIIATRDASATGTPTNITSTTYLAGGTAGSATYSVGGTWDQALQALREYDVAEMWIDQDVTDGDATGEGVLARVKVELDYRHGQGGRETHLHLATSAQPTKTIAKATVVNINRDYATVYANETKYRDRNGTSRWWAPKYTALRVCCAAAGLARLGMNLTNKRLDVEDVRHGGSNWSYAADAEELVKAGLCLLAKDVDRGGFKVVRWITTFRGPDVLRTQASTVRAMNASTMDLRRFAATFVGGDAVSSPGAAVLAALKNRLSRQVNEFRWLKSFTARNLSLTDAGVTYTFDANNLNPVEPIDFVYIRPEYSRTVTIL